MYGKVLAGAAPNPAAHGVDAGAPPAFDGQLPMPTNVGAMPTGTPGTSAKAAADEAVLALRTLMGYQPSLKDTLEQTISAIKGAAGGKSAGPPAASLGSAQPPGAPLPATPATDLSGSPGPT